MEEVLNSTKPTPWETITKGELKRKKKPSIRGSKK
jgi:hypothetical protein